MSVPMVAASAVLGGMSVDVRPSDPITSHEARDSITPEHSEAVVYAHLYNFGPQTDEQLIHGIQSDAAWGSNADFSESRIRTARKELERKGLVRFVGYFRLTSRGRRAQVWEVKP